MWAVASASINPAGSAGPPHHPDQLDSTCRTLHQAQLVIWDKAIASHLSTSFTTRRVAQWPPRDQGLREDRCYTTQQDTILANYPELDALTGYVRSFAQTLTERRRTAPAVARRRPPGRPAQPPHSRGRIDRDRDAVIAGLTLPWNSGAVEGHVNRIKMLKRQMFGRAGFALLRKRVLLAH